MHKDLLILKAELEKPGIGQHKHDLAECFKEKNHVPLRWIRKWINTEWYVTGHKYLWLAAMNACINRSRVPLYLIYQGLRKTDQNTFNAAVTACRNRKVPFEIILWWYGSSNTVLHLAAINACIGNSAVPKGFIEQTLEDEDIRIRRIAQQILG